MEGAPGSQPRGVGAPREDGSSVSSRYSPTGGDGARCDRKRQRTSLPARARPNKRARVTRSTCSGELLGEDGMAPQLVTAAPNRGITWGRALRQRKLGVAVDRVVSGARRRARGLGGA